MRLKRSMGLLGCYNGRKKGGLQWGVAIKGGGSWQGGGKVAVMMMHSDGDAMEVPIIEAAVVFSSDEGRGIWVAATEGSD